MKINEKKQKFEETNRIKKSFFQLLDKIIDTRFLIGFIIFIFILVFKLHGSSINMWDNYVSDYRTSSANQSGLLIGQPRAVRSDEWLVQTPFSLSQTQTGFKEHNEVITLDGQDMVVGYNSPATNLATVAKPFTWGYVLLGKVYGLSWYWGLKLIGLVLLSFEIGLILTKRNKYIALLASLWIPFSSAIQWWFVSPVGDLVFFTLGFLVSVYNYFFYHEIKWKRLLFATTSTISISGFVLVLYPALQVPLGYLIVLMLAAFFFEFYKRVKLDKFDGLFIGGAVLVTVLILVVSIYSASDSLSAVMNTAYPGKRVSLGGDYPKKDLFLFLTNWKLPFSEASYDNSSELSSFYHLFFVILPLSPLIFFKKIRENLYGFLLFSYCCFHLLWMSVSFPSIFAKFTLWSYVTTERAIISFGFTAVLLSLWFLQYVWEKQPFGNKLITGVIGINVFVYSIALYTGNLRLYISKWSMVVTILLVGILFLALFKKWKICFCLLLSSVIVLTGLPVNPIATGVSAIYGKKIADTVQKIEKDDPNQLWVGERLMYGYLPALGVHTFNGVAFTPSLNSWEILDPKKKNVDIYNRYAHINVEVGDGKPTLELLQSDAIVARLNAQKIQEYGIKYLVTYKKLEKLSTESIRFEKIYGPDLDGAYIYKSDFQLETE